MVALRTIGLAVLAAAVAGLGILAIYSLIRVSAEGRARGAAVKASEAAGAVVATSNPQSVKVKIPGGYIMRFIDNYVSIDVYRVPQGGLALSFADDLPDLEAGEYELVISAENSRLVVRWT